MKAYISQLFRKLPVFDTGARGSSTTFVQRGIGDVFLSWENEAVARAYLEYWYSEEGQDLAGKHFYRPRSEQAAAKYATQFAPVRLVTIDEVFGGWQRAQKLHFAEGGWFDQLAKP